MSPRGKTKYLWDKMSPNHLEQAGRVFPQSFLRTANTRPWSHAPPLFFVLRTFLKLHKPEPCYSQIHMSRNVLRKKTFGPKKKRRRNGGNILEKKRWKILEEESS